MVTGTVTRWRNTPASVHEVGARRPNFCTSRLRNSPTSVPTPTDSSEPRSLSLVTTDGLISTYTSFTPAGVMLPTSME